MLLDARRALDGRVREAPVDHPHRGDMLKLNGGRDLERSMWEWANVQAERD